MENETVRYSPFPFRQVVAIRALCSDNRQRWARVGIADSWCSAPARVSVSGRTVSGFILSDSDGTTFHASPRGKHAGRLPRQHAPARYWKAAWRAHCERSSALLYCGPLDTYRGHGIRTAATEGHSMIEHVRPHALAHLAAVNSATLATIDARRYGWDLATCRERERTPDVVANVDPPTTIRG